MTTLLPTPLEAAAKAFQHAYHERADTLEGYEAMLAAAITAYLAQAEKEGWVMVPVGMVRKVTSIARRNEDAPEIGALSVAGFLRDDLTYDDIAGLHQVVKQEIRSIIRMALDHPEARTVVTRPSPGAADE